MNWRFGLRMVTTAARHDYPQVGLHGTADAVVAPSVAAAGAQFYRQLRDSSPELKGMVVHEDGQRVFAHNLPISASGDNCVQSVAPYLGRCGFDAAGEIFLQMFGEPHDTATTARGELRTFDQDALLPGGADAFMAKSGYVYLPPDCVAGKPCGLMVALHGCLQNADAVVSEAPTWARPRARSVVATAAPRGSCGHCSRRV